MNPASSSLLDQLAPAHASAPPGLWPLAPGWWLLLVLLLSIAATLIFWLRRPARRLRKLALIELRQLEQNRAEDSAFAGALENLLRRYAIARFGREAVASLNGESWIEFVAQRGGGALAGNTGDAFLRAAYGGRVEGDRARWLAGTRGFIRRAA